jgi:hypothetical protein
LGGEAMKHVPGQEALAALGLRPEDAISGDGRRDDPGACVVARLCDIDISLQSSA